MQFQLFDDLIPKLRKLMADWPTGTKNHELGTGSHTPWPQKPNKNIVFQSDTAVELGSPEQESVSFILWTNDLSLVNQDTFTLNGPDMPDAQETSLPFGKVIILGGSGFNEDNCYQRHQEIELARYDLNLEGYMIRAASQYMREWSRISKRAMQNGFDFRTLAQSLRNLYLGLDYIHKVETVFLTSSISEVQELSDIGKKATDRIIAMNRIADQMDFDCESCDLREVCNETVELRKMHRKRMKQQSF